MSFMKICILLGIILMIKSDSILIPCQKYMNSINIYLRPKNRDELFIALIDITSQISLFATELVNDTSSSLIDIKYKNKIFTSKEIKEDLIFKELFMLDLKEFTYYGRKIEYDKSRTPSSILAFGLDVNESNSLTHLLKKLNVIDKTSFSFDNNIDDKCAVYFGSSPVVSKFQYKNTIRVLDNLYSDELKGKWNIRMDYFATGKNNIYYNSPYESLTHFSTSEQRIKMPHKAYQFLIKTVFAESLNNNVCKFKGSKKDELSCDCDELLFLTSISFGFDGKNFELELKKLFVEYDYECIFLMEENKEAHDKWIIGNQFLFNFFTEFDYDNRTITFYSHSPFGEKSNQKNPYEIATSASKFFLFLMMILMVINIIIIIYLKQYKDLGIINNLQY